MVPPPHWNTDQSRRVYLVRLISIWFCIANGSCFKLPCHWTCLTRALAEDDNSEERAIFVNLGLGLVFYGLLVKCSAMSLFERS
jgi:hypothetical protein